MTRKAQQDKRPREDEEAKSVRLDQWLWAARFYKTRTLAKAMIEGGKVHYDGHRVKPGKEVHPGVKIELSQGFDQRTVIVTALACKRGSASDAAKLYEETAESIEARSRRALQRKQLAESSPHPRHRPDKKARRQIIRFSEHNPSE